MDDYKKYSLGKLEEWMHDALSCSKATPQEIYDIIRNVVEENYYTYKNETEKCYELLALLNGNGKGHITIGNGFYSSDEDKTNPWYDYFTDPRGNVVKVCDKDDPSPECKGAWNDFWEEHYYPEEYSQYTEDELNAMCDKAQSDNEKEKCREYNIRESEYYNKRAEIDLSKIEKKQWVLPVELDGLTGDCMITLPDDLLQEVNWKEGEQLEWIDNENGSFTLRKVNGTGKNS